MADWTVACLYRFDPPDTITPACHIIVEDCTAATRTSHTGHAAIPWQLVVLTQNQGSPG